MQTPISSPTDSREIPSGSEGWYSDCLSLRLTLDAVLLHVLYLSRRRATASLLRTRLSGWEDRLPLTCSLRSPELSEVELHSSGACWLHCCGHRRRKPPVSASMPSQPAVKCAKEPMCQRTGVPLRCLSVLQVEDPTSAAAQRHWVSATGERHFQETAQRCLRLRADLSLPRETRENPKAWT